MSHTFDARTVMTIVLGIAAFGVVAPASAQNDTVAVRSGERADVRTVYWVDASCSSRLVRFRGIDVLQGVPGVTLSIREEKVFASRWHCPEKVPGGTVVLSASEVASKASGTLEFRVLYDTQDGPRQSYHKIDVVLYPSVTTPTPSAVPSSPR